MPSPEGWKVSALRVVKTEEKGSDVNLATFLLMDAFDDLFDVAVIISNDSDLKEPIAQISRRVWEEIGILAPEGSRISRALLPLLTLSSHPAGRARQRPVSSSDD